MALLLQTKVFVPVPPVAFVVIEPVFALQAGFESGATQGPDGRDVFPIECNRGG